MKTLLLLILSICCFVITSSAQAEAEDETATKTILEKDRLFWTGYNACDAARMNELIADDVEFYHDKGGITLGKSALADSLEKNLCGDPNFRTRREAAAGTVKVYLLKNSNALYGAIVSGDHYFFNSRGGKPEKRDGLAKFANLWILKDGAWKMARILSYDHRPAPYENKRAAKVLTEEELRRFGGQYVGNQSGDARVTAEKGVLILTNGNSRFVLYPETNERFFVKERDLTFEFVSENGEVARLIIRENGEIVEEAKIRK
ncbi:MAG TPA: nuclear transport factor 2 family protein [Pyrinomonadaceae bacterium]